MLNKWQKVVVLTASIIVIVGFLIGFIEGLFYEPLTAEEEMLRMVESIFGGK